VLYEDWSAESVIAMLVMYTGVGWSEK